MPIKDAFQKHHDQIAVHGFLFSKCKFKIEAFYEPPVDILVLGYTVPYRIIK